MKFFFYQTTDFSNIVITRFCTKIQSQNKTIIKHLILSSRIFWQMKMIIMCYSLSNFLRKSLLNRYINIVNGKGSFPANTKTSQRHPKNVSLLVSKTSQNGLKWKQRRPFFKTSSRRLLRDIVKTSSRRRSQDLFQKLSLGPLPGGILKTSKTSLRPFLAKAKDYPGGYL